MAPQPKPVDPTPGVNAPVAKTAAPPQLAPFPTPGHFIDNSIKIAQDRMAAERELRNRFVINDGKRSEERRVGKEC